jgi:hypothetical protein
MEQSFELTMTVTVGTGNGRRKPVTGDELVRAIMEKLFMFPKGHRGSAVNGLSRVVEKDWAIVSANLQVKDHKRAGCKK